MGFAKTREIMYSIEKHEEEMNSSHQLKQRNFLVTLNGSSRIETYDKFIQVRKQFQQERREDFGNEAVLERINSFARVRERRLARILCGLSRASKQQYSGEQKSFFHKKIIACSDNNSGVRKEFREQDFFVPCFF
jgi:hypothetical protein